MTRHTLLLAGGLLLAWATTAQDLSRDLEHMARKLTESPGFRTEMAITVYDAEGVEMDLHEAELKRSGQRFYYRLDDFALLAGDRGVLAIDHGAREMTYARHSGKRSNEAPPLALPDVDSLLATCDSVRWKETEAGRGFYALYTSNSELTEAHLHFSTATGFYERVQYFYQHPRLPQPYTVSIAFRDTDLNPAFGADEFSEESYLVAQRRSWKPVAAYQDYQLIINDLEDEE